MFRTQESLAEGCVKIDEVASRLDDLKLTDRTLVWNTDLIEALELHNLMPNAQITMHSAEQRRRAAARTPGRISPTATTSTG